MSDVTWPPSDDLLRWRPEAPAPTDTLPASVLAEGDDDEVPDWVAVPEDAEQSFGEVQIPVYALAYVETDAGRPGGGGATWVSAVPTTEGDLRIVITNDDEMEMTSPIERVSDLPTLGEVLRILDETQIDGETWGVGHPTRVHSDVGGGREELRGFVTIRSSLYPQLEALDQSRLEQWIAERP